MGHVNGTDRRQSPRDDASRRAHHDAIYTLARAAEDHDPDTGAHVLRIRAIVECIALHLGIDEDEAADLGYDAMLHDVGKLRVPPDVLTKPGPLTSDEQRIMQRHTVHGEQLLAGQASLVRAARIARSHHEAWDGTGYPDGLVGDDIPREARITAAADVFDALLAERPYKRAWPLGRTLQAIQAQAGTQLDPAIVDALLAAAEDGSLRTALNDLWAGTDGSTLDPAEGIQ